MRPDGGAAGTALFLDVDGVLNDKSYFIANPSRHAEGGIYGDIDREKIALLNEVVRRTGCLIVLSSSWRSDTKFRMLFRGRGARVEFHPDWRTIRISDSEPNLRGREIAEWLSRHRAPSYAIVDDDSDMLPSQRDRFVQTSFETGMTREHAERLVRLLTDAGRDALGSSLGVGAGRGGRGEWVE